MMVFAALDGIFHTDIVDSIAMALHRSYKGDVRRELVAYRASGPMEKALRTSDPMRHLELQGGKFRSMTYSRRYMFIAYHIPSTGRLFAHSRSFDDGHEYILDGHLDTRTGQVTVLNFFFDMSKMTVKRWQQRQFFWRGFDGEPDVRRRRGVCRTLQRALCM